MNARPHEPHGDENLTLLTLWPLTVFHKRKKAESTLLIGSKLENSSLALNLFEVF